LAPSRRCRHFIVEVRRAGATIRSLKPLAYVRRVLTNAGSFSRLGQTTPNAPRGPVAMAADGESTILSPEGMATWGPSKSFAPLPPPGGDGTPKPLQTFAAAAMSETGERAVLATTDGQLHALQPAGGYLQAYHRSDAFGVRAVAFTHHEASVLYSAGKPIGERSGTIVQHRLHDNTAVRMYSGHGSSRVVCIAVCPTRDIFLSTDEAGAVVLWSVGKCNAVSRCIMGSEPCVACFDGSGSVFAVASPAFGIALYSVVTFAKGAFASAAAPRDNLRRRVRARVVPPLAKTADADAPVPAPSDAAPAAPYVVDDHAERWTHVCCSPDGKLLALTTSLGATHLVDAFSLAVVAVVPEWTPSDDGDAPASSASSASPAPSSGLPTVLGNPDGTAMASAAFTPCGRCLVRPTASGRPESVSLAPFGDLTSASKIPAIDGKTLPRALLGSAGAGATAGEARHPDPVIGVVVHPSRALVLSFSATAAALWTPAPAHRAAPGSAGSAALPAPPASV